MSEESQFGGHGYSDHVNTTIADAERWVLKRANSRRYGGRGTQRRGVFNSAAEADRLIADVLAAHPDIVRQVSSGVLKQAELIMQFSQPTGLEASAKGPSSIATISVTYGVKLVLRHLPGKTRGNYILTAFPANRAP